MSKERKMTVSGLNYPGTKFIEKNIIFFLIGNDLYINGKRIFPELSIRLDESEVKYYDNEEVLDLFNGYTIKQFIQHIFRDKWFKFKGDNVVKCYHSFI